MKRLFSLASLCVLLNSWAATTYYVSPSGTGTSTTTNSPGALAATLSAHSAGDSIVLLSGLYAIGTDRVVLTQDNVRFYGYPGSLCVLSNHPSPYDTFYVSGNNISVSNIVLTSTHGGTNTSAQSWSAYQITGQDCLIVDVVITRCGTGMTFPSYGQGTRVVGAILLNNGVSYRDSNFTVQNNDNARPKIIEHSLFANPGGWNVYFKDANAKGITFRHNILYHANRTEALKELVIRAEEMEDNLVISTNLFFGDDSSGFVDPAYAFAADSAHNKGTLQFDNNYGYGIAPWYFEYYTNLYCTNNWFVDRRQSPHGWFRTNAVGKASWAVDYNTYGPIRQNDNNAYFWRTGGGDIGYSLISAWKAGAINPLEANSVEGDSYATTTTAHVWKHPLRDKTGLVTIYNYQTNQNVTVDVSSLGMTNGEPYCLVFAQNPLGGLVRSNAIYGGSTISIPMTNVVEDLWTTNTAIIQDQTMPMFGSFIVCPPSYFLAHAQPMAGGGGEPPAEPAATAGGFSGSGHLRFSGDIR